MSEYNIWIQVCWFVSHPSWYGITAKFVASITFKWCTPTYSSNSCNFFSTKFKLVYIFIYFHSFSPFIMWHAYILLVLSHSLTYVNNVPVLPSNLKHNGIHSTKMKGLATDLWDGLSNDDKFVFLLKKMVLVTSSSSSLQCQWVCTSSTVPIISYLAELSNVKMHLIKYMQINLLQWYKGCLSVEIVTFVF